MPAGPGGGFCLFLEVSAAALSGALSKSLPPPLGERVFIFLSFQQMEPEPNPGKTCLLPQPAEKQVKVAAWRGWSIGGDSSLSRCHQGDQVLRRALMNPVSANRLPRAAYLSLLRNDAPPLAPAPLGAISPPAPPNHWPWSRQLLQYLWGFSCLSQGCAVPHSAVA